MSALDGITVLELCGGRCGAFAGTQLADFGARVVRLESAPAPYGDYHGNKDVRPVGPDQQVLQALATEADIIVTDWAAAELERLGLDYARQKGRAKPLVYAQIRDEDGRGGDMDHTAILAQSGLMRMTGFPDAPPVVPGGHCTEYYAGVLLAFGLLSAQTGAELGGAGSFLDFSVYDALFSILESPIMFRELKGECPGRSGSADPGTLVPYDVFQCRDGYFAAGLASDAGWDRFCGVLGRPELIQDPRYDTNEKRCARYEEMTALFAPFFLERTQAQLQALFDQANIPSAPVLSAAAAMAHPQLQSRGMALRVNGAPAAGSPMNMSLSRPVTGPRGRG